MIRDTTAFAYAQGFWERLTLGDSFGRTHETSQDWNEAYDSGANLADWFRRDSDGTASAALCEDIAVPQDCQARPSPNPSHRPIRRENNG